MEVGTETPIKSDSAPTTSMAIRCAKASHLLYSLQQLKLEESLKLQKEIEDLRKMQKEIGDLRVKVARERLKNKRLKLWRSFELLLLLAVIFSLFALFLVLSFHFLKFD